MAEPSSDDLSARYSSVAKDKSLLPKVREAAMFFSVAEVHLDDEETDEALKAASDALNLFRAVGETGGVADTLRIVIGAHYQKGAHDEALRIAEEELTAFRAAGDKRGEAAMLLSVAEVSYANMGSKRRDAALESVKEARALFQGLGDQKMEGRALLASVSVLIEKGAESSLTQEFDSAVAAGKEALAVFQGIKDQTGEAKALHGIAAAHAFAKSFDEAVAHSQKALTLWGDLSKAKLEAFEWNCISQWHYHNEHYQEALDAGEKAADLMAGQGWDAMAVSSVTSALIKLGEAKDAIRMANAKLEDFKNKGNRAGEIAALDALVAAHTARGDHPSALRAAEQALAAVRRVESRTPDERAWEAGILHAISSVHMLDEQFGKANTAALEAMKIFKELGAKKDQARVLNTLSSVNLGMQDFRDAIKNANDAKSIFNKEGHKGGEATAAMSMVGAACARNDYKKAASMAQDAQTLWALDKNKRGEADATYLLAYVYQQSEDFQKSIAAARKARDLYRDAGELNDESNMLQLLVQSSFYAGMEEGLPLRNGTKPSNTWDKALAAAKDAVAFARRLKNEEHVMRSLCFLAQVLAMTWQHDEAKLAIDEGLEICEKKELKQAGAYFHLLTAQMYVYGEEMDKAVDPSSKAVAIFKELADASGEFLADEMYERCGGGRGGGGGGGGDYAGPSQEMLLSTVMSVALSLIGTDSLAGDTALMDAGLDSLASVEFQNTLQKDFQGINLPSTLVFDHPTPGAISEFIYAGLRDSATR